MDVSFEEFVSHTDHLFSFQRVSHSQVLSRLNILCKNKATGLDSVSARLLRECPYLIAESFSISLLKLVSSPTNGRLLVFHLFLKHSGSYQPMVLLLFKKKSLPDVSSKLQQVVRKVPTVWCSTRNNSQTYFILFIHK